MVNINIDPDVKARLDKVRVKLAVKFQQPHVTYSNAIAFLVGLFEQVEEGEQGEREKQ